MNRSILPAQQRFLAFVSLCLGIIFTSLWGATQWGPIWGLLFPIPLLIIAFILRWMFFPRFSGRTRVQLASLAAICLPATLYIPSNPVTLLLVVWLSTVLHLDEPVEPVWVVIGIQLLITLGVIGLNVIWHLTDVSQPQENPEKNATSSAADREYERSLERYCNPLIKFLDRYDDEVNWSDRDLTPLEAEVETERSRRLRPRIVPDMVSAIRRDRRSDVFIVLGDPGSGKSVSLRRLVRVLCTQASRTGVVPVYVNLREWTLELGEVTPESLVGFAKERARFQTGRDGRSFLDTWYEPFRKSGRLFFVIDSFDELPAVLDCDDKSDLHRKVSAAFDRFFTQEIYSCRAVLASRHFRAPVGVKGTRLIIRPFRESQIRQAIKTWLLGRGINTNQYIRQLFRQRPQLVPLLRNPFTAELIAEYARAGNGKQLPDSMFAVFDHYISTRLYNDEPTFKRYGVTPEQVRKAAGTVAKSMYESESTGLETDVDQIRHFLNCEEALSIIEALKYSRIARVGGYNQRGFSFVHRRFAEFFVVDELRRTGNSISLEAIPTDSRWRDCLVMYCGISELSERQRIAKFCWSKIDETREQFLSGQIGQARPAIHCLRFLNDAFRADILAIQNFQSKLGKFLLEATCSEDPLIIKIGAEAIPLIAGKEQQMALLLAFQTNSSWIFETALGSCRHIGNLHPSVDSYLRRHLREIPIFEKILRFDELNFSLSLSDAFQRQRHSLWADLINLFFLIGSTILLIILYLLFFPGSIVLYTPFLRLLLLFFIFFLIGDLIFLPLDIDRKSSFLYLFESALDSLGANFISSQNPLRLEVRFQRLTTFFLISFVVLSGFIIGFGDFIFPRNFFYQKGFVDDVYSFLYIKSFFGEKTSVLYHRTPLVLLALIIGFGWENTLNFFRYIIDNILNFFGNILNFFRYIVRFQFIEDFKDSLLATLKEFPIDFNKFLENIFQSLSILTIRNTVSMLPLFFLFLMGLYLYLNFLPHRLRGILESSFLTLFGWLIIFIFSTFIITFVIKKLFKWFFRGVQNILDYRRIKKLGWPSSITCEVVYENCFSLRSVSAKKYYLESLRKLRIPLMGDVIKPPQSLLNHPDVAEGLAKLREQWYGLSN